MTIRPCEHDDLEAVIGLLDQLSLFTDGGNDLELSGLRCMFEAMSSDKSTYLNLVAEIDGRVVAFESIVFYKTLFHRGGTALINELIIDQAYRGQGIGSALVSRAVEEAKGRGMDEIEVGTEISNHGAAAFYKSCGFDREYTLMGMEF